MFRAVFGALTSSDEDAPLVLPLGGNNPAGVLGQVCVKVSLSAVRVQL